MAEIEEKDKEKVVTENRDLIEIKEKVDNSYRTDYLTLPNIPPMQDPEADKQSALERELILNPDRKENIAIRDRYQKGIFPKDAPPEVVASIGKHTIEVDKDNNIIVTGPSIKVNVQDVIPAQTTENKLTNTSGVIPPQNLGLEKPLDNQDPKSVLMPRTTEGSPKVIDEK